MTYKPMGMTVDELVSRPDGDLIGTYKALEAQVDMLETACKEAIEPIKADMDKLMGALTIKLDRDKRTSANSQWGTAYFRVLDSVKVVDRQTFFDWVIENKAVDVLTSAVAKDAVRERGDVPGVEIIPIRKLHIRKPT